MKKLKNQGLTLVELILAMAISSIIIGAIIIFMSASSRSYQSQESEISLQMEAQAIMNQIHNLVVEGNNVEFNSTLRTLSIYHNDSDASTTIDKVEIIWYNNSDHCMYLYNTTGADKATVNASIASMVSSSGAGPKDNLLGEYVNSFLASPASFVYDRSGVQSTTLSVDVEMEFNGRTYTSTEDIKLRNRIVNLGTP